MTVEEAYDQWTGNPEDLELCRSVAHGLASQPNRDGRAWKLAFAYLDMTDLPVQVFPLLRALMETREACATAAVIATSQFDLLWDRMMNFPFAWWQVPMPCWRTALTRYWEHMRSEMEALDDRDRANSILTEELCSRLCRLKKRLPGLCPAFDFLSARLLGRLDTPTSAKIVNPQMLDWLQGEYSKHRRECLARMMNSPPIPHLPQARNWIRGFRTSPSNSWSDCLFVNRVGPFSIDERADYADAPAMTAAAVLLGCEMPSDLARAIREVREDQAEWFDEVLCLAQQIAFGRERAAQDPTGA